MSTADELKTLLSRLAVLGYRFTTVTPETHALVNARSGNGQARTLRDVFGWNRRFTPEILPKGLFDVMRAAEASARRCAISTRRTSHQRWSERAARGGRVVVLK